MRIAPVVERYDKIVRDIQSKLVVVDSAERGNREFEIPFDRYST